MDENEEPELAAVYAESLLPVPAGLTRHSTNGVDMGSASRRVQHVARSCLATAGSLSVEDRTFLSDYQVLAGGWFDSQPDDATRGYVAKLGGLATYLLAQR